MNKHYLFEQAEGAIILDGFDDCLIGIAEEFGNGPRLIYSKDRIIHKLQEDMTEEEAHEYYDYNILGGYFGEQGPVFYLNP
jgi:hypothetical protein